MKVKCINTSLYEQELTEGKVYDVLCEVTNDFGELYRILCDSNREDYYLKERFEGYEIKEVDLLNNLISSESYFELSTSPLSIKASYLRGKNERN